MNSTNNTCLHAFKVKNQKKSVLYITVAEMKLFSEIGLVQGTFNVRPGSCSIATPWLDQLVNTTMPAAPSSHSHLNCTIYRDICGQFERA